MASLKTPKSSVGTRTRTTTSPAKKTNPTREATKPTKNYSTGPLTTKK